MAGGKKQGKPKRLCRDCAKAYDFHCKNVRALHADEPRGV